MFSQTLGGDYVTSVTKFPWSSKMVKFHSRQVFTLENNFPHGSLPAFLEFYIPLKMVSDLIQNFNARGILCFGGFFPWRKQAFLYYQLVFLNLYKPIKKNE